MKVGVKILLKKQVLDVQGRAIADALKNQGYKLNHLSYGKFVELDIPTDHREEALQQAHQMVKSLLYNPLMETYSLETLHSKKNNKS